jgi:hypothetical protein
VAVLHSDTARRAAARGPGRDGVIDPKRARRTRRTHHRIGVGHRRWERRLGRGRQRCCQDRPLGPRESGEPADPDRRRSRSAAATVRTSLWEREPVPRVTQSSDPRGRRAVRPRLEHPSGRGPRSALPPHLESSRRCHL